MLELYRNADIFLNFEEKNRRNMILKSSKHVHFGRPLWTSKGRLSVRTVLYIQTPISDVFLRRPWTSFCYWGYVQITME